MDQKIQTKEATSTTPAVLLTIGMVGAFLIGVSMVFALSNFIKKERLIDDGGDSQTLPVSSAPLKVKDVTGLNVGLDVKSESPIPWAIQLAGVTTSGTVEFGTWGPVGGFTDANAYGTDVPVAVRVYGNHHGAAIVTFQTGNYLGTAAATCTDTDPNNDANTRGTVSGLSLSGEDYSYSDSCSSFKDQDILTQYSCTSSGVNSTPQSSTTTCANGCSNGACIVDAPEVETDTVRSISSLLGIKAADAQVTSGTKHTICIPEMVPTNLQPNQYYTYYAGADGNLYYDMRLTARINTVDCSTIVEKAFAPNNISNITSNGTIDLGEINGSPADLFFFKTLYKHLGYFNSTEGFQDFTYDAIGSTSPLMVGAANQQDSPITFAEQTLTVTSDLGVTNLCFPAKTVQPNETFVYYYDMDGNPYTDLNLTNQVSCGESDTTLQPCTGAKTDPSYCWVLSEPAL